jgi:hypothetical protein
MSVTVPALYTDQSPSHDAAMQGADPPIDRSITVTMNDRCSNSSNRSDPAAVAPKLSPGVRSLRRETSAGQALIQALLDSSCADDDGRMNAALGTAGTDRAATSAATTGPPPVTRSPSGHHLFVAVLCSGGGADGAPQPEWAAAVLSVPLATASTPHLALAQRSERLVLPLAHVAGTRMWHSASRDFTLDVTFCAGREPPCGRVALRVASPAQLEVLSDAVFDAVHRYRRARAFATAVAVIKRDDAACEATIKRDDAFLRGSCDGRRSPRLR